MRKHRRLWDTYRFPSFRPNSTVQGIFGDPQARVICLHRRGKKRSAEPVATSSELGTTASCAECATWRAETIRERGQARIFPAVSGVVAQIQVPCAQNQRPRLSQSVPSIGPVSLPRLSSMARVNRGNAIPTKSSTRFPGRGFPQA